MGRAGAVGAAGVGAVGAAAVGAACPPIIRAAISGSIPKAVSSAISGLTPKSSGGGGTSGRGGAVTAPIGAPTTAPKSPDTPSRLGIFSGVGVPPPTISPRIAPASSPASCSPSVMPVLVPPMSGRAILPTPNSLMASRVSAFSFDLMNSEALDNAPDLPSSISPSSFFAILASAPPPTTNPVSTDTAADTDAAAYRSSRLAPLSSSELNVLAAFCAAVVPSVVAVRALANLGVAAPIAVPTLPTAPTVLTGRIMLPVVSIPFSISSAGLSSKYPTASPTPLSLDSQIFPNSWLCRARSLVRQ